MPPGSSKWQDGHGGSNLRALQVYLRGTCTAPADEPAGEYAKAFRSGRSWSGGRRGQGWGWPSTSKLGAKHSNLGSHVEVTAAVSWYA